MNKKEEAAPFWLPPISLVAIVLMVLLVSFVWPILPFRLTGQALMLAVLVRAFVGWPPMQRWAGAMPVPHRIVPAVLLFGMVAGHFTLQTHRFFPFMVWEIFTTAHESDPVTCREFIATTADGKAKRLLVEQIFPSIVQFNPPADNDSAAMTDLVAAMARVYNEHHADNPVQKIDLVLQSVPLHPAANEAFPPCEQIKSFPISSARSN
jgi:hypothetical protein